jgi:hypothetical protein
MCPREAHRSSALGEGGHLVPVAQHGELPGIRRIHTYDPFGNRLEFQQAPESPAAEQL